jgi:DNA-binding CsgD family transcriptional regulator
MNWLSKAETIDHIVDCLEALGTREFAQPFFSLIDTVLAVDQCMIFMLSARSDISCLLSRNFRQENLATPLARAYIEEGHRSDPGLDILSNLAAGESKTIHMKELLGLMPVEYRDRFFRNPNLTDKVSIMRSDGKHRYYINLYRSVGKRSFSEDGLFCRPIEGRLISSIIAQHYSLNDSLREEGPLAFLSDRERQTCKGVLDGKKMEAIAADFGVAASSVVTYRKRAYEKLGITSRGALFALCRQ